MQGQLNFSRDVEREADRVGFQVMTSRRFRAGRHGLDVREDGPCRSRLNDFGGFPYLRTHPLTVERIGEARARAGIGPAAPARRGRAEVVRRADGAATATAPPGAASNIAPRSDLSSQPSIRPRLERARARGRPGARARPDGHARRCAAPLAGARRRSRRQRRRQAARPLRERVSRRACCATGRAPMRRSRRAGDRPRRREQQRARRARRRPDAGAVAARPRRAGESRPRR